MPFSAEYKINATLAPVGAGVVKSRPPVIRALKVTANKGPGKLTVGRG